MTIIIMHRNRFRGDVPVVRLVRVKRREPGDRPEREDKHPLERARSPPKAAGGRGGGRLLLLLLLATRWRRIDDGLHQDKRAIDDA